MAAEMIAHCDAMTRPPSARRRTRAGGNFCSGADRRRWIPAPTGEEPRTPNSAWSTAFMRVGCSACHRRAVRGSAVGAGLNLMLAPTCVSSASMPASWRVLRIGPARGGFFTIAPYAGREATASGLVQRGDRRRRAAELGLA